MKISDFAIKHHVIITIFLVAALIFGLITFASMKQEMFSNVGMPSVMIITVYPGVGPNDVEKEVTNIIEEAVSELSGIRNITSSSVDSLSVVEIQFDWGTDIDKKLPELREKINKILEDLPDGVDGIPTILKMSSSSLPMMTIAVDSPLDRDSLTDFVKKQVVPQLIRIEGIARISVRGGVDKILNIKIHIDLLESKNVSVLDLFQALKYNNISLPAGSIVFQGSEINLRTFGDFSSPDEIKNLVIGYKDNTFIRIKDVADVKITNKKIDNLTESFGNDILVIDIQKQQDKDTIKIAREINKRLKKIEENYNNLVTFKPMSDQSADIKLAIKSVSNSAIQGALLAVIILFVFLRNIRATLIIAVSIPLSILFTFIAMKVAGMSINLMTIGGLTVGIGMIVDASIVVLENVYKIFDKTKDSVKASSVGTSEVGGAIIASTSTSLAVFIPIAFVKGFAGMVLKDIAFTVIFALTSSLLVAIIVVPYLTSLFLRENKHIHKITVFKKFSDWVGRIIDGLILLYKKSLKFALENRVFIFVLAISVLIISFFIFNFMGFEFLSETDMDEIQMTINTPAGYTLDKTRKKVYQIEQIIKREVPEVENVVFYIGLADSFGIMKSSNVATGKIRLIKHKLRKRSVFKIIDILRDKIKNEVPDVDISIINGGLGALAAIATGGEGFMIEVYGNDFNKVYNSAKMIEKMLREEPLVEKAELDVKFDRQEMVADLLLDYMGNLGVSSYEAAITSRILFHGMEVGKYRTSDKTYDIYLDSDVVDQPVTEDILNRISLRSQSGKFISFANITDFKLKQSASVLHHKNKQKSIIVTAYLKKADFRAIQNSFLPKLRQVVFPVGVNWEVSGQAKEMAESFKSLFYALLIAIFLVYMVMVIQFERFTQPLIVMLSIPFTVIGVALGLILFGSTLSIVSFLGIIMLAGLVVNNAIVMIDYINLLRKKYKKPLVEAIIEGSGSRLRPILMTTLTTILGVIPMALSLGEGSEIFAPLGQSVAGGLITSTLITLFVVPSIYYSLEITRLKRKMKKEKKLNEQNLDIISVNKIQDKNINSDNDVKVLNIKDL